MNRLAPALVLALLGHAASAATFVVDTTLADASAPFQACTAAAGDCSLSGAIAAANAASGADRIEFDLLDTDPGYQATTAHWRFALAGELQSTGTLEIDGFSQAGALRNTNPPLFPVGHALKIELRGPNLNNTNCLLAIGPLTVRGLVLGNCNQAVYLFEPGPHLIEGSHIGVDVSGQSALPNRFGVALGGDVVIGEGTAASANVISGNLRGALVQFRSLTRLRVQGNVIGPNAAMTEVPGIQDYGVQLLYGPPDSLIGGVDPSQANTISGNGFGAVYLSGSPQAASGPPEVRVLGNVIGVGLGGVALGNGLNPGSPSQTLPTIQIGRLGYCRVAIGGDAPGEGNLIAHSGNAGVAVGSCQRAPILGNSFLANRGAPIDLAGSSNYDGATANDAEDSDGNGDPLAVYAGNRLQNTAEIVAQSEDAVSDELRLSLRVDSTTASAAYPLRIDLYRNDEFGILQPASTQAYGEADAQQAREYLLTLSQFTHGGGIVVTDANGNSSEMLAFGDMFSDGFEGDAPSGGN